MVWMIAAVPVVIFYALLAGRSRADGEYGWMAADVAVCVMWVLIFYREFTARKKKNKEKEDSSG